MKNKKVVVLAVLRSRLKRCYFFLIFLFMHGSLAPKILGAGLSSFRNCQSFNRKDLAADLSHHTTRQLQIFIGDITHALSTDNFEQLASKFHPRLKVTPASLGKILGRVLFALDRPITAKLWRGWAFSEPSENIQKNGCDDRKHGFTVYPLYGNGQQVAVILNLDGKIDSGRLFLHAVMFAGNWHIGSFYSQRMTHDRTQEKNWGKRAKQALHSDDPMRAYVYSYTALKLKFAGGYFIDHDKIALINWQQENKLEHLFREQIHAVIQLETLLQTKPLFAKGGSGLLLRFSTDDDMTLSEVRKICQRSLTSLVSSGWYKGLFVGLRCSFILPREPKDRDGVLGSIWLDA